ncbi:MAG: 3-dehydroquinate synthase [Anaerocolumna sp.]
MNHFITISQDEKPIYNISLKNDLVALKEILETLCSENKKVCVVTDTTVGKHYLNTLTDFLAPMFKFVDSFVFPAGEDSKNLSVVTELYEKLINAHFDRKDILIALGGGVVGDLTGFCAATYLRGIQFIQMPTSLLAMVDSSIGGKTGVDFMSYKNMVGAFHQPSAVYMNLSTLLSLDDQQYYSGFGEIIKHGLIKDANYYTWLMDNKEELLSRNLEVLKEMVYRSCLIKKEVVEKDPKELGDRALLNFGHTIGHAVEKLMDFKLLHGECVSVGIVAASYISLLRNNITQVEYEDIKNTLLSFYLPIQVSGLDPEDILKVMSHDKKVEGDKVKFILLNRIGDSRMDTSVTREELIQAINSILV